MKAAFIREVGPPTALQVGDLPDPTPGRGEVRVRVHASSVNPIDTYLRSGMVKPPTPLPMPYIVGGDLAGVVDSVGDGVSRFKPGDRVWGALQGINGRQGATAEFAVVGEGFLFPSPDGASDEELAALALVSLTAHIGLFRDANLRSGETVFVNGGSGGIGSAVLQIAKATCARVITTAGSPEKAETCRQLGADEVILYKDEDVPARVRELAPDGIQVWYENLRSPELMQTIPLMAPRGRMILMAGRDATPSLPLGNFYTRQIHLLGLALLSATPDDLQPAAEAINKLVAEGKLIAQIGRVFAIDEIAQAHQLQEDNTIHHKGDLQGKIVVRVE